MATKVSRRAVLGGMGAGAAQVLLTCRVAGAGVLPRLTGKPGLLDLDLTSISANVLRIGIAPVNAWASEEELGVVAHPYAVALESQLDPVVKEMAWGKYRIAVEENPLRVTVTKPGGKFRQQIQFDDDSTAVRFGIADGPVFGMGEGLPTFDLRGARYRMHNGEGTPNLDTDGARLPIPWLVSASGWGLLIGQPSGVMDLRGERGVFWPVEATSTRNVYLIVGDEPREILRGYAELTGFPHLPPRWALGYQQSHRTLASKEEVLGIARSFREKKLPCDTLIYLGTGFCPSGWNTGHGSFTFNEDVFPNPKAMFGEFHAEHFKVVLHVVPPGDFHGTIHDTGPTAREPGDAVSYWKEHLPVEAVGVDGWWADEGDRLSVYNRLDRNKMYWEGPLTVHPKRRPFALNRNGYAGLQRYGWLWSGDVTSTWKTLAAQVRNGINTGLSGVPYWGTDTGGFTPTLELTPELYLRWFQFSAFCPLFRSHGQAWKLRLPWGWDTGKPGPLEGAERLGPGWPPEAELHDAQVEVICRKYLELRYRMLPYVYSTVEQTHRTGLPMMRALWFAYPGDRNALLRDDEYLWGDAFLVAPVLEKGARQRRVYLPEGEWWDFWTGEQLDGGREVTREVDLETIPLYVKAGAVVPLGPVKQWTEEPVDEPLTLRVYPGADGEFAVYEDDGESFRYREGEFTRLLCAWRDAERKLTVRVDENGRPAAGRRVRVEFVGRKEPVMVTLEAGATVVKM